MQRLSLVTDDRARDKKGPVKRFFFIAPIKCAQTKTPIIADRRFCEIGAGNETRTRDPDLGKVVLYQLSYSRKWRPLGDSNPCYRRERAVS